MLCLITGETGNAILLVAQSSLYMFVCLIGLAAGIFFLSVGVRNAAGGIIWPGSFFEHGG